MWGGRGELRESVLYIVEETREREREKSKNRQDK